MKYYKMKKETNSEFMKNKKRKKKEKKKKKKQENKKKKEKKRERIKNKNGIKENFKMDKGVCVLLWRHG